MSLNRRQPTGVAQKESSMSPIISGNLPEGDNEGRLVYVADLGLQAKEYKGEFKGNYQMLSLGIEMVGQTVKTEDGQEFAKILWTKPFYIYPSMNEKSKEFEFYSIFDPTAVDGSVPDWEAQLNKPVNVYVTHTPSKDGTRTYDNISKLSPIPTKYQSAVEPATTEPCVGDADDANNPCTQALFGLAKFMYDKRIIEYSKPQQQSKVDPQSPANDFDDPDVPF